MQLKNEAQAGSDSSLITFHETFGSLGGCMLEGDAEQSNRERRTRRWSLGISVALQTVLITAMVIAPMLARTEPIFYRFTPFPPYAGPPKSPHHPAPSHPQQPRPTRAIDFFISHRPAVVHDPQRNDNSPVGPLLDPNPAGPGSDDLIPLADPRSNPKPPVTERERNPVKRLVIGHIEPAMLTQRVEPIYPQLAIQVHRAGRVELRAIIATDGSIQSLEVVEGDPLFLQSALNAVSRWHYRPTMLNGQAVEVDTHITVIYSIP